MGNSNEDRGPLKNHQEISIDHNLDGVPSKSDYGVPASKRSKVIVISRLPLSS